MTAALIFSRDRPAQLDLLLRSLNARARTLFSHTTVLYRASGPEYLLGYKECAAEHPHTVFCNEHSFQHQTWTVLHGSGDATFAFLCDDDIIMRPLTEQPPPEQVLTDNLDILCFSLRLGLNTDYCYPLRRPQQRPHILKWDSDALIWSWLHADGDFGYPGSLDGHVFRVGNLMGLIGSSDFTSPNRLEEALNHSCWASERPLMACYRTSLLVGNAVNRVQHEFPNRHGETYPADPQALNQSYLAGNRLRLPHNQWVDAAHTEIELSFA